MEAKTSKSENTNPVLLELHTNNVRKPALIMQRPLSQDTTPEQTLQAHFLPLKRLVYSFLTLCTTMLLIPNTIGMTVHTVVKSVCWRVGHSSIFSCQSIAPEYMLQSLFWKIALMFVLLNSFFIKRLCCYFI